MSAPFASYAEFEAAVLAPIEAHRREHLVEHWEQSAGAVRELLDSLDAPSVCSAQLVTEVTGWLNPRRLYRLDVRRLERLNPGYTVRVHRLPRRELGRLGRLLRAGFRVEALWAGTGPREPFALAAFHREAAVAVPASNADAHYQQAQLPRVLALHEGATPVGYVDQIAVIPRADDDQPTTWLAELAHRHPQQLRDLLESHAGQPFAAEVALLLATYPENARWADKFALTAHGAGGVYRSDLVPLRVLTPNPTPATDAHSFIVPEPVDDGPVVTFAQRSKRIPSPNVDWLSLSDAIVEDGGTVRTAEGLVVYEASAHPASDFVSGQFMTVFGSRAHPEAVLLQVRPESSTVIPEGILLAGRNDFNWFHWLVEYLPRVLMAEGVIAPDVPVLVTARTPPTGREALALVSNRPVIEVDYEVAQRVSTLHVLAPPVQVLDTTGVPWIDGLSLNESALRLLQAALTTQRPERPTRRIFLERNSRHRGLANEHELAEIAALAGLERVDPGSLTFADQLELFTSAELLVGASGAVMANYLTMSPGSRILALSSDGLRDFVLPAALAAVAGASFTYLTGEPTRTLEDAPDLNQWLIQSDFTVDAALFRTALAQQIAALDTPR